MTADAPSRPPEAPPPPEALRPRPLLHAGQGLLMGTADVIPGVSGGTVALIVGIYERLVDAVRDVTAVPVALRHGPRGVVEALRAVQWLFVIPLGVGILTAIGLGALVIPGLLATYPAEMRALFFGLVAASLVIPWRRAGRVGSRGYALAAVTAVVAFFLVALPGVAGGDPSLVRVFGSAAVAICAMILPGVSGAFLLAVLGMYEPTLAALRALDVAYVLTFALGALTGLALFSRLLSWLLTHHYQTTMVVLVGLLAGSLRALWPWQGQDYLGGEWVDTPRLLELPATGTEALVGFALAALGFALVTGLAWLGGRGGRQAR